MKILRIVSLLGCGLLWSCQSQEPAAPPTDDVPDIKTVETVIQQITNDVNSVEVDNIIGSLFGKEKKGRSAEYDVHVIKDDKGNDRIICVNFADNKGYALVSAVKSYEPILAYAETGHFSPDDELPLPVKAWMENTMIDIDESQTLPTDSLAKIASKWRRYEHIEGAKTFESYREVEIWTFTYPDTFTSIYHEESDFSQSRLLYINWGYPSPGYNGYYSFSSMTPKIATGNGPVTDYTSNRLNEAIINIRPNK